MVEVDALVEVDICYSTATDTSEPSPETKDPLPKVYYLGKFLCISYIQFLIFFFTNFKLRS